MQFIQTRQTELATSLVLLLSLGAAGGMVALLTAVERLMVQNGIRQLNTVTLGLFFGFLLGIAIDMIFTTATQAIFGQEPAALVLLARACLFLTAIYAGVLTTMQGASELNLCIPFIRFTPGEKKQRSVLLDLSVLLDPRLIDLAASKLLDNQLLLPRFVLNDLYKVLDEGDENERFKARRAIEVVKKLEALPDLALQYTDIDYPDSKEGGQKIVKIARLLDCHILTADTHSLDQAGADGVHVIDMHRIAKALKPITHSGEYINIKVQRYGKEARQGIGYLDDGTMVVVNGGAEFIGETIRAQVLSVKHTTSGRMIFSNAINETESAGEQVSYASPYSAAS